MVSCFLFIVCTDKADVDFAVIACAFSYGARSKTTWTAIRAAVLRPYISQMDWARIFMCAKNRPSLENRHVVSLCKKPGLCLD